MKKCRPVSATDPGSRGQELLRPLRVDYRALPGALQGGEVRGRWWNGDGSATSPPGWLDAHPAARPRLLLRDDGAARTAQLFPRQPDLAALLPVWGPNHEQLFRKLEEVRSGALARGGMRRGSDREKQRTRVSRAPPASIPGQRTYGFAAGSDYYFDKPLSMYTMEDAGKAALLRDRKAPRD